MKTVLRNNFSGKSNQEYSKALRRSHLQLFLKIDILKTFANFTGKHLQIN